MRDTAAQGVQPGLWGGREGSSPSVCACLWLSPVIMAGVDLRTLGSGNISGWECLLDLGKDSTEAGQASFCLWLEGGGEEGAGTRPAAWRSNATRCSWLVMHSAPSGVTCALPNSPWSRLSLGRWGPWAPGPLGTPPSFQVYQDHHACFKHSHVF